MPQLGKELIVVVAANNVVRHRDSGAVDVVAIDSVAALTPLLDPDSSLSSRARMIGMIRDSCVMTTSGSISTSRTPEYEC